MKRSGHKQNVMGENEYMKQSYFFKNAAWVGKAERTAETFSVLRGSFHVNSIKKVTLNVLGLGFFKCYINGKCINPDTFLPLSSDFEATCDPTDEVLSGHRVYVPRFDITGFVPDVRHVHIDELETYLLEFRFHVHAYISEEFVAV